MTEPRAAVELRDVTKRYADGKRTSVAVDGVSLALERGSFVVLRGPSGSGKTTLLGLMAGLVRPTSGEVELLGKDIVHMRDHHRVRHRRASVGIVLQELGLIGRMTVVDNALLPLAPLGGPAGIHLERIASLTARFGIAALRTSRVETLSGGERQRAAIVRALVLDPPMLLLDEPSAHLDAERTAQLAALLVSLRDEGRTIVIASHDARLCEHPGVDRSVEMRDGRLMG